jgi:hypothetical protein
VRKKKVKNNPKFYYIYIITNLILNKQYVGSKVCYKNDPLNDGYWGSSKYLKKDYEIYGKENFKKEILKLNCKNKIEMLNEETKSILKYNTLAPNGYNHYLPNKSPEFHTSGLIHSDETKKKISINNGMKGKKYTNKEKEYLRNLYKGKTIEEIYGPEKAKEMKEKMRKAIKRKKEQGTYIPSNLGKKNSKESNIKRSKTLKGRIPWNKGKHGYKRKHSEKIHCFYCKKMFDPGNYTRWHGENCRNNTKEKNNTYKT